MTVSPDLYPANSHMMMSPDVYPPNGYMSRPSSGQQPGTTYLPSVSYSLDHLDRLDYQVTCSAVCDRTLPDHWIPAHFRSDLFLSGSRDVALPA